MLMLVENKNSSLRSFQERLCGQGLTCYALWGRFRRNNLAIWRDCGELARLLDCCSIYKVEFGGRCVCHHCKLCCCWAAVTCAILVDTSQNLRVFGWGNALVRQILWINVQWNTLNLGCVEYGVGRGRLGRWTLIWDPWKLLLRKFLFQTSSCWHPKVVNTARINRSFWTQWSISRIFGPCGSKSRIVWGIRYTADTLVFWVVNLVMTSLKYALLVEIGAPHRSCLSCWCISTRQIDHRPTTVHIVVLCGSISPLDFLRMIIIGNHVLGCLVNVGRWGTGPLKHTLSLWAAILQSFWG